MLRLRLKLGLRLRLRLRIGPRLGLRLRLRLGLRLRLRLEPRAKSQGMADDSFEQQLQIFFDKNFPESELLRKSTPSYI